MSLTTVRMVILALWASACAPMAPSMAVAPAQEVAQTAPEIVGPLHVTLLGNYAGKVVRLEVDGEVLVERRMMFPPPGATDRFDIPLGPARSVPVKLDIEGCPASWTGEFELQPGQNHALIVQGCGVEASLWD